MNKLNFQYFACCKAKNNKCCICFESNSKSGIQCKLCAAGTICINCVPDLCESGLCKKCPVCRQENWKSIKIKKTKIVPIKKDIELIEISTKNEKKFFEDLPPCKILIDRLACICTALFISYFMGMLTVCSFTSSNQKEWDIGLNFLGLLLGMLEMAVIGF